MLKLSQESFVYELLARYEMLDCTPADTPMDPSVILRGASEISDEEAKEYSVYPIKELTGGIGWLAQISRPDIAVAWNTASQLQHRPSKECWDHLQRILRYLKKTPHWGLVYQRPTDIAQVPLLELWADASLAPQIELNRGKSMIGHCFRFVGALVAWTVMKSRRVLLSSAEAECYALTEAQKENVWQRDLQACLGIFRVDEPTQAWEDNTAAITLSASKVYHKRSKHFGVEWCTWFTRDAVQDGLLHISYVPTEEQLADFLTKALYKPLFEKFRALLMGTEVDQLYFGRLDPPVE